MHAREEQQNFKPPMATQIYIQTRRKDILHNRTKADFTLQKLQKTKQLKQVQNILSGANDHRPSSWVQRICCHFQLKLGSA